MPHKTESDKSKMATTGHFSKLPNAVLRQHGREIGPYGFMVYGLILGMVGVKGSYPIGLGYMTRTLGISKSKISDAVRILENAHLIRVEHTRVPGKAAHGRNVYHILPVPEGIPPHGRGVYQDTVDPLPADGTPLYREMDNLEDVPQEDFSKKTSEEGSLTDVRDVLSSLGIDENEITRSFEAFPDIDAIDLWVQAEKFRTFCEENVVRHRFASWITWLKRIGEFAEDDDEPEPEAWTAQQHLDDHIKFITDHWRHLIGRPLYKDDPVAIADLARWIISDYGGDSGPAIVEALKTYVRDRSSRSSRMSKYDVFSQYREIRKREDDHD
jgi:hypothetical protein